MPVGQTHTPHRQLIEIRLGQSLDEFVAVLRADQPGIGWRVIADRIYQRTGVTVSHMTLRRWFSEAAA